MGTITAITRYNTVQKSLAFGQFSSESVKIFQFDKTYGGPFWSKQLIFIAYLLFISIHNWNYFYLWFELNLLRISFIMSPS